MVEVSLPGEVDDLLYDFNVFLMDSVNVWNPLAVHLVLELLSSWSSLFDVLFDISDFFVSKIFVSLGSSSPFVRDSHWVLELNVGWSSLGCWSHFSLLHLIVPSGFVHLHDVLSSSLPFLSILLEFLLSSTDVLNVVFDIFFDLPFEGKSVIDIFINVLSHLDGSVLLFIGNKTLRIHLCSHLLAGFLSLSVKLIKADAPDLLIILFGSISKLLELFWPGSFDGLSESSLVGSDAGLVFLVVINQFLFSHGVVG